MSIEKVVAALNAAFAADPCAIHALIVNRVPCNQALADDPFVQVDCPPVLREGLFQVGAIGLINGVLAAIGLPLAATMFSDEKDDDGRSKLLGFTVYKPSQSEVTEVKSAQPERDQYWQHKTSEDRVYFVGRIPDGEMVFQCEGDGVETGDLDWSDWQHLQGCDSWAWKPKPVSSACDSQSSQYWSTDSPRFAYLRVDANDKASLINHDGTVHQTFPWNEVEKRGRLQITKEQAEELEIHKPKPVVAEPAVEKAPFDVMGQSPDDWVPLDEKYDDCQLLPGYQFRNVAYANDWKTIGSRDPLCGRLIKDERKDYLGEWEYRCCRSDLPVVNARIPVALYWYDGAIVGRYADCAITDPSFIPVHSDGNGGWFIERSRNAGN